MNPFMGFLGFGSVISPTIHLPNPGLGVGAGFWITDQLQLKATVSDAAGDLFGDDFWDSGSELFDGNTFKTAEVGWIPDATNPYAARITLMAWHVDAYEGSDEAHGIALASNWTIGKWVPTLLAGWSSGGAANVLAEKIITVGTGYRLRSQDVLGATYSWVDPVGDLRNQSTTEVYFRFYVSELLAVTPNLQWVRNPALNSDVESMTYFQLRARIGL
jgi:porin